MSKFITFEGCEATGKSTQAAMLARHLRELKYDVILTKEPGGTSLGEKIRTLLLEVEIIDAVTELMLLSASRREHVKAIRSALQIGKYVISDRFSDSSIAYQGYAKGLDIDIIQTLFDLSLDALEPDITFLLDADVSILVKRMQLSDKHNNCYDTKDETFHEAVRQGFLFVAKKYKHRIIVLDATLEKEIIHKMIMDIVCCDATNV